MKKIYLLATMFAASVGLTSCGEDFLKVDRYGIVTPEVLLTSQKYVEQGLNGVYDLMYPERNAADIEQGWLLKPHLAMSNYPTLDVQADGWDVNFNRENWSTSQAEFLGGWQRSYKTLDRANRFLANLANADSKIFDNGETTMKIIESEARALRAYFYYWLVQNFGGVPIVKAGETYSNTPGKERGTAEEAWNMIIEDLTYADQHIGWEPWKGDVGRVTKGMIKAYLAQAYMYTKQFDKAKTELKAIIDSHKYSLNPCFGMIHLPGVYWQPESVWEVSFPMWSNMGWGAEGTTDAVWWPVQLKGAKEYGGWGPAYISFEFCWSFEPGDKRLQYSVAQYGEKNEWYEVLYPNEKDATNTLGLLGKSKAWRSAFIGSDVCPNNADKKLWKHKPGNPVYTPLAALLIRYSSILLNYAECCFETGDEDEGWTYIDMVRDRAWGALESQADPVLGGNMFNGKTFPFALASAGTKAPSAKTYYATYKRTAGKIGGKLKKLTGSKTVSVVKADGSTVDEDVPTYEETTYESSYSYTPYTAEPWKVALVMERRHEFMDEYCLWYDICRMGMATEYLNAEYPKNNEAINFVEIPGYAFDDKLVTNPHTVRAFDHQVTREIFPIPFEELTKNPALDPAKDQNPGY